MDESQVVEEPIPQPIPPRSVGGAVLLNLTGLGLGYAYLRRWLRAGLYAAGTCALVVIAFATDASQNPWLWRAIAAVWLGWAALEGWLLARRSPQPAPGRDRLVPVLAGVVALALVVSGCVVYGAAERATFADGLAAQGRADCTAAVSAFDAVTGPYRLTLSSDVSDAARLRTECQAFTRAQVGDPLTVASAYERFRSDYRDSVLRPVADENVAQLYVDRAKAATTALRGADPARVATAKSGFDALLRIKRDLGGTRAAAAVPTAMQDLSAAAETPFAAQQFCEARPVLDYETTLPADLTGTIVPTAHARRAQAMLGCGLAEFRAGKFPSASSQLRSLITTYPNDPGVQQARSADIAAAIAQRTPDPIPVPLPFDRPGRLHVTFYNVTSKPMPSVKVTGTNATEFALPGCDHCPPSVPDNTPCPAPAGHPAQTLLLDPGLYHVMVTPTSPVQTLEPQEGDNFCAYLLPRPA